MRSQFRLAAKRNKQPFLDRSRAVSDAGLPLSMEMNDWLISSMSETDCSGMMSNKLANPAIQPLDAISVYCPHAAVGATQFSAAQLSTLSSNDIKDKTLSVTSSENWREFNPNNVDGTTSGTPSSNEITNENHETDDPILKLRILWLERKAKLEVEDGSLNAAYKSLGEAIELHVGTNDYSKAKLCEYIVRPDPEQLLKQIETKYVIYTAFTHVSASLIQSLYRRFRKKKSSAATVISRYYRGYKVRRAVWEQREVHNQCAAVIQRVLRAHNSRVCFLAVKLQRWYALRKQMKVYSRMLKLHRAALSIQSFFTDNKGRVTGILLHRLRVLSATRIQRVWRGSAVRRRKFIAMNLYIRLINSSSYVIQKAVRQMCARIKMQIKLLYSVSRETERQRIEDLYLQGVVDEDRLSSIHYIDTTAGQLHQQYIAQAIRLKDNSVRFAKHTHNMSKDDSVVESAAVAFHILNSSGSGRLRREELTESLQHLGIPITECELSVVWATFHRHGRTHRDIISRVGETIPSPKTFPLSTSPSPPIPTAAPLSISGSTSPSSFNPSNSVDTHQDRGTNYFAGGCDFRTFLAWYKRDEAPRLVRKPGERSAVECSREEGSAGSAEVNDDTEENSSTINRNIVDRLRARLYGMEVKGQLMPFRARVSMLQLNSKIAALKGLAVFRQYSPPRFECCQCRAPFSLFLQYTSHFHSFGICSTTDKRGIFFRKCSSVWGKQRQCERETVRLSELEEVILLSMERAWFAESAVQGTPPSKIMIRRDAMAMLLMEEHSLREEISNKNVPSRDARFKVLEMLELFGGEGSLHDLVASRVASELSWQPPVPVWGNTAHKKKGGAGFTLSKFRDWLSEQAQVKGSGCTLRGCAGGDRDWDGGGVGVGRGGGSTTKGSNDSDNNNNNGDGNDNDVDKLEKKGSRGGVGVGAGGGIGGGGGDDNSSAPSSRAHTPSGHNESIRLQGGYGRVGTAYAGRDITEKWTQFVRMSVPSRVTVKQKSTAIPVAKPYEKKIIRFSGDGEDMLSSGLLTSAERERERTRQIKKERFHAHSLQAVCLLNVTLLRLLHHTSREMILVLLLFQHTRPRRMTMTDSELRSSGLSNLCTAHLTHRTHTLCTRYSLLSTRLRTLYPTHTPHSFPPHNSRAPHSRVNPLHNTESAYHQNLEVQDLYKREEVCAKLWTQSPMGREHVKVLSSELYAADRRFKAKALLASHAALKAPSISEVAANSSHQSTNPRGKERTYDSAMQYLLYRFSRVFWTSPHSPHTYGAPLPTQDVGPESEHLIQEEDLGCEFQDFELLSRSLGLWVEDSALPSVERDLDPLKTGWVDSGTLGVWVPGKGKEYISVWRGVQNAMLGVCGVGGRGFERQAREVVLLEGRRRVRMERQLLSHCVLNLNLNVPVPIPILVPVPVSVPVPAETVTAATTRAALIVEGAGLLAGEGHKGAVKRGTGSVPPTAHNTPSANTVPNAPEDDAARNIILHLLALQSARQHCELSMSHLCSQDECRRRCRRALGFWRGPRERERGCLRKAELMVTSAVGRMEAAAFSLCTSCPPSPSPSPSYCKDAMVSQPVPMCTSGTGTDMKGESKSKINGESDGKDEGEGEGEGMELPPDYVSVENVPQNNGPRNILDGAALLSREFTAADEGMSAEKASEKRCALGDEAEALVQTAAEESVCVAAQQVAIACALCDVHTHGTLSGQEASLCIRLMHCVWGSVWGGAGRGMTEGEVRYFFPELVRSRVSYAAVSEHLLTSLTLKTPFRRNPRSPVCGRGVQVGLRSHVRGLSRSATRSLGREIYLLSCVEDEVCEWKDRAELFWAGFSGAAPPLEVLPQPTAPFRNSKSTSIR